MPKVTDEHRQSRRQQILDAALRCFARKGLHRASMQDIIEETGLSAGAIYIYFAGKDEIIEAIADERHAREEEQISAALAEEDPEQALGQLGEAFIGALKERRRRDERQVGIDLWAEALHNPRLRRIVRRGIDQPRERLREVISAAQARNELPAYLDPDALARVLIAIFHGFVLQQAWDRRLDLEAYLATTHALVNALAGSRPPARSAPTR